jgi:hypothetical protein
MPVINPVSEYLKSLNVFRSRRAVWSVAKVLW